MNEMDNAGFTSSPADNEASTSTNVNRPTRLVYLYGLQAMFKWKQPSFYVISFLDTGKFQ